MRTTLLAISFALLACTFAQDCNNPLLAAFNLTGLQQPETVQGLSWCSNLQNGQSCCSNDTVNQFQGLLQNLIDSLENETGARDQVLVGFRNNLLDAYQDAVSDLTDNDDQLASLTNANAAVGNEVRSEWSRFQNITDLLSDLDDDDLNDSDADDGDNTDDDNDFFVYLQNLQVARETCLEKLLDVQSSIWCLACDPNWASLGVNSNGTVLVSQQVSNDITTSCYNYTVWSQRFNPLLIANQTYQRVQNLNNYLRNYGNDNSVLQNANVSDDVYTPVNASEQTVVLPPNCSNSSCNWQTLLLLSSGSINQSIAANGAGWLGGANVILPNIIQGSVVNSTVPAITINDLISNSSAITLVIQGNANSNETAWTPANNVSGIPIDVSGDPAQVSGLQDGVLAGVTGAIVGGAAGTAAGAGGNLSDTDNDGINTDNTDNDGINTDANDPTDNDGVNTDVTDNDGINTDANDVTDNDGVNTDVTDNDGINTDADDVTDNDGVNTDANDPTDNDNNSDNN